MYSIKGQLPLVLKENGSKVKLSCNFGRHYEDICSNSIKPHIAMLTPTNGNLIEERQMLYTEEPNRIIISMYWDRPIDANQILLDILPFQRTQLPVLDIAHISRLEKLFDFHQSRLGNMVFAKKTLPENAVQLYGRILRQLEEKQNYFCKNI